MHYIPGSRHPLTDADYDRREALKVEAEQVATSFARFDEPTRRDIMAAKLWRQVRPFRLPDDYDDLPSLERLMWDERRDDYYAVQMEGIDALLEKEGL